MTIKRSDPGWREAVKAYQAWAQQSPSMGDPPPLPEGVCMGCGLELGHTDECPLDMSDTPELERDGDDLLPQL